MRGQRYGVKSVHPGDDGLIWFRPDWFVVTTKNVQTSVFKSLSMRQAWIEHESLILAQNERWRQA